jgi:hypothetical protein
MHKEGERLIPINIVDEMKTSYIDYSMSVIVSRALPDVRDGLNLYTEEYFTGCMVWVFFQTENI